MRKDKASPRPWCVEEDLLSFIVDARKYAVASCKYNSFGRQVTNTKLIVCAVNAHDDLVANLKTCADELAKWVGNHYVSLHHHPGAGEAYERDIAPVRAARAALAKAEAGTEK